MAAPPTCNTIAARRWLAVATLATLAALALAGCQDQEALRRAELAALVQSLPGTWSSEAQAAAGLAAGGAGQVAVQLDVTRVSAPVLGRVVLRVRESAAGDLRRVLADRLWVFDELDGRQLVAQLARFNEPARWAAAGAEALRSLVPQDVTLLPGCSLRFTRAGAGWSADTAPAGCPAAESGAARLVQYWRIGGESLAFAELAPGRQPTEGDWYRLDRQPGGAP